MAETRKAMQDAWNAELRAQIESTILGRYDMSLEEFRKKGRRQFGDSEFAIVNKLIREFSLRTSFLVCGTDKQDFPHVFTVSSVNGSTIVNDPAGRGAIGTGGQMALGALGARKHLASLPVRELIYRVCEAKFSAETARGVGKGTILTVWRKGFEAHAWGTQIDQFRSIRERLSKESAPDDAIDAVNAAFAHTGVFMGLR